MWLFGLYSENIILARVAAREPEPDSGDTLSPNDRFFYESLRQQLNMRCGFVCPGLCAYERRSCWWTKLLQRVYARLPKEERRHFSRPN